MAIEFKTNASLFNKQIRIYVKERVPEEVSKVTRSLGTQALRGVVFRTPVDTGRARGGWQVTLNSPTEQETNTEDKSGGSTFARGIARINGVTAFETVWVQNNVKYIVPLENGHSKQAPDGMLGPTVSELRSVLAR